VRPTGVESIRAIQVAFAETIVPELSSAFAQDAAGTMQMLLESIAGEWDTAAEDLRKDNETICSLLSQSRHAIERVKSRNESLAALVPEIESLLRQETDGSLTLTNLKARNDILRTTVEHVVVEFEGVTGEGGYEGVDVVRLKVFGHLRDVATRGWSFWDVSSFRGRMTALRSAAVDDARATRAVE
jgi:hypothetical protein